MQKLLSFLLLFCSLSAVSAGPPTFLLKPEVLLASREKIKQGDPVMKQALATLLKDADKALTQGPYSVTYKSKAPASGDKHDYMSVGPYWWPDPTKADGLPYIRKDGQVNPERYAIRDAEYHNALCKDVYTLGLAWFFTADEKYAAHAAKLLRTWFLDPSTRMNPHLNFGQAIPGRTDGRGIGIIDTRNLAKLIDGVQLLKNSSALKPSEYAGIQSWYRDFLQWMRTSPIGLDEADEHNNHGTWYDVQTVAMALFTEQPALAKQLLEEQTEKRIESQLKEDGSQPHELARTLSWSYSQMNLKGFFELAMLAENVGIDLWNFESPGKKSLRKAYAWMLPYAAGEKDWKHQQIKPADHKGYLELSAVAGKKFPSVDQQPLHNRYKDFHNDMMTLTEWTF
ncbi:alginate lyase family protein [Chitinophaga cymbidii]|uniref:Alginate lyase n=1 Tax=Chitinophaga cymbidii TaxID=1096750 RepID=A0A512RQ39_9BACT|nr:alginate lyase family protein [Chitinophaga cymbidii]GEP97810.1 alginate lyase [Chitinophaga cymbidii]